MATDGAGYVYVAWENNGFWVARSTDGGCTFEAPIRLSSFGWNRPEVAAVNRASGAEPAGVYVAFINWEQRPPCDFHHQVYLAKSPDSGTSWEAPVRVPMNGCESGHGLSLAVATEKLGEAVVAAWGQGLSAPVFVANSLDGGATWNPGHPVTPPANFTYPNVSISSGLVHLTYRVSAADRRVYYAQSFDLGDSFEMPRPLSSAGAFAGPSTVRSEGGGHVLITWQDQRHAPCFGLGEVYAATSADNGQTWVERRITNTLGQCQRGCPCVDLGFVGAAVASDGLAFLAWGDVRNFAPDRRIDVFGAGSSDFGNTYGAAQNMTPDPHFFLWTGGVDVSGADVLHAWTENYVAGGPRYVRAQRLSCVK